MDCQGARSLGQLHGIQNSAGHPLRRGHTYIHTYIHTYLPAAPCEQLHGGDTPASLCQPDRVTPYPRQPYTAAMQKLPLVIDVYEATKNPGTAGSLTLSHRTRYVRGRRGPRVPAVMMQVWHGPSVGQGRVRDVVLALHIRAQDEDRADDRVHRVSWVEYEHLTGQQDLEECARLGRLVAAEPRRAGGSPAGAMRAREDGTARRTSDRLRAPIRSRSLPVSGCHAVNRRLN